MAAGEKATVYYLPVSGGYTAFIDKIACDWAEDTYYEFIVDGVLIEKVKRLIPMDNAESFNPPIISTKSIKWIFHNDSDEGLEVHILCDGSLCKKEA